MLLCVLAAFVPQLPFEAALGVIPISDGFHIIFMPRPSWQAKLPTQRLFDFVACVVLAGVGGGRHLCCYDARWWSLVYAGVGEYCCCWRLLADAGR